MSLLVDATICPDCRALLSPENVCTGCGLELNGPLAVQLWGTMQVADGLVERLRSAPAAPAAPAAPLPAAPPVPAAAPRRSGLSAGSVPAVLFGVGATCLLVAAVVFVAVAWGSLGIGARTTILLGVTAALAALAARLTTRGLRGAAETFWLIVGAMVTLDLGAAYGAGLLGFDAVPERHAAGVVGLVVLALGLGLGRWTLRTELGVLVAATVLAAGGAFVVVAAEAWAAPQPAAATAVSVLGLAALALGVVRQGLRATGYALAALGVLSWVLLVAIGVGRAEEVSARAWWLDGEGWPLLVAAALAAAVTFTKLPDGARIAGAAAAQVTGVLLLTAPGVGADAGVVLLAAIAAGLAALASFAPRVWAWPATCLAGVALLVSAGYALLTPLGALAGLPTTGPTDDANLGLRMTFDETGLAPWTSLVVAATVVLVTLALAHRIVDPAHRLLAVRTWLVGAPTVAALGVATLVLETSPTLVVGVLAWTGVLVVLGALAATVRGACAPGVLAAAGYLGVVGLRLAVPSHLLAAALATALAVGLGVAYRRTSADPATRMFTAIGALLVTGFAATHWPYVLGATGNTAGVTLVLVAVAAGLLASRAARDETDRIALEVIALVLGLVATQLPVDGTVVTVVLTLLGTGIALLAVLHTDRELLGWLATVVLGLTALERIAQDVTVPELVTAPAALLLLAVGIRRLVDEPAARSLRLLGSGLTLAFGPSLVLVLDEPVSVRGALLGAFALAALAFGVRQRWAAPFLAGAAVLAVLAVRHLGPVAEGLPRWISLGAVGAVLLTVAITWEARRRELAVAERYLTALR